MSSIPESPSEVLVKVAETLEEIAIGETQSRGSVASGDSLNESDYVRVSTRDDGLALQEQHRLREAWTHISELVLNLTETLEDVQYVLAPSKGAPQVSATTKRRLSQRSGDRLQAARQELVSFHEQFLLLEQDTQQLCQKITGAENARLEAMRKLKGAVEGMEGAASRIKSSEEILEHTKVELAKCKAEKKESDELVEMLSSQLARAQDQCAEEVRKREAREAENEQLRASEAAALAASASDGARRTAAEQDRAETKEALNAAETAVTRHSETVARLTADNVVFLMRLQGTEAELGKLQEENRTLRAAAEQTKSSFFDSARMEVERTVQQTMAQTQQLKERLEVQDAEHAASSKAEADIRSGLEVQVAALQQANSKLELDAAQANELAAAAGAARNAALNEKDEACEREAGLSAEVRVLTAAVRDAQAEAVKQQVTADAVKAQMSQVGSEMAAVMAAEQAATRRAEDVEAQLATQKKMNESLMARKQEVEWQLVAALANVDALPATQSSRPPPPPTPPIPSTGPSPMPTISSADTATGAASTTSAPSSESGSASASATANAAEPGHPNLANICKEPAPPNIAVSLPKSPCLPENPGRPTSEAWEVNELVAQVAQGRAPQEAGSGEMPSHPSNSGSAAHRQATEIFVSGPGGYFRSLDSPDGSISHSSSGSSMADLHEKEASSKMDISQMTIEELLDLPPKPVEVGQSSQVDTGKHDAVLSARGGGGPQLRTAKVEVTRAPPHATQTFGGNWSPSASPRASNGGGIQFMNALPAVQPVIDSTMGSVPRQTLKPPSDSHNTKFVNALPPLR